jgi:phenylalanyl-tRNA synthetase beta chain
MAVIPLPIEYAEKNLNKNIDQIKETLNSLGFPSEIRDKYLDVEVTPNRLDMHTIEGILRTLSSFYYSKTYEYKIGKASSIIVKNVAQRPFINAIIAKDVKDKDFIFESLITAQEKIHETYGRKRKKLAIGVHDLKKVKLPLTYEEQENVSFIPLGYTKEMSAEEILKEHEKGKLYSHLVKKPYPVVKDKKGVISLPPIINSARTQIDEKTTSFLIEITGTDENAIDECLKVFATALADRNASIKALKVNNKYLTLNRKKVFCNLNDINKLSGLKFEKNNIIELMKKSNIIVKGNYYHIPAYRSDIKEKSDIIEEILINYGYENIKPEMPYFYQTGSFDESMSKERAAFLQMAFNETIGFFLISKEFQDKFLKGSTSVLQAVSKEHDSLRKTLLFNLLFAENQNKMKQLPHQIFEIGHVYRANKEIVEIGFIIADKKADINNGIAVIKMLSQKIGKTLKMLGKAEMDKVSEHLELEALFIKGRFAWFDLDIYYAIVGEVNPELLDALNIINPITAGILFKK